jgi:hypothetical protein
MIKKNRVKLVCLMFFLAAAVFFLLNDQTINTAHAFSSGPLGSHTGAPGERTCATSGCHPGPSNSGPGLFTITGLPARYDPGMTYEVSVRHSTADNSRRRWGFQLTVLTSDNAKAGNIVNNSGFTSILNNDGPDGNRQYIEHNQQGTFPEQSSAAGWTFNWTAPSSDVGPVTFYAAGNQANNDSSNSGDQIYRITLTVNPPAVLSGPPRITSARVNKKQLIITGENFDMGALLFMDEGKVKKTFNDEVTPTTTLVAGKAGKSISPGQTVVLQVRNLDGTTSENFTFTRPQ